MRILVLQPRRHGFGVIHLARAHVVSPGTGTNAAVIETQCVIAAVARGALQGGHHLVEHGAALHRVGVAYQGYATGFGHFEQKGFELPHRAGDGKGGFATEQH